MINIPSAKEILETTKKPVEVIIEDAVTQIKKSSQRGHRECSVVLNNFNKDVSYMAVDLLKDKGYKASAEFTVIDHQVVYYLKISW